MLALIRENEIIPLEETSGWVTLPDGSVVSPAVHGWTNGEYSLRTVLPADPVPEDKVIVGSTIELVGGEPKIVNILEDLPTPTPEEIKERLLAYAAEKRWEKETGGLEISGYLIDTTRESQAMINGAYNYAQAHPEKLIKFKTMNGWVVLDASTMISIAMAVGDHVQQCFDLEESVDAQIRDGTIETEAEIDLAFA